MIKKYEKNDILILKSFINTPIPNYIKNEQFRTIDLMEYYEEIFNYSHSIIKNNKIDLSMNSHDSGKSIIFTDEYEQALLEISKTNDINLKLYCYMNLSALITLKKISMNRVVK